MLDARQPLYRLAQTIDWKQFETAFGALYADEGRPALPIRRMVGLLLLKQLHNLSDERAFDRSRELSTPTFSYSVASIELLPSAPLPIFQL